MWPWWLICSPGKLSALSMQHARQKSAFQQLLTEKIILPGALLLIGRQLLPASNHAAAQPRFISHFLQRIIRVAAFNDVLHLPVEWLLTIMINRAEHRDVIRLIFLTVVWDKPPASQSEDQQQGQDIFYFSHFSHRLSTVKSAGYGQTQGAYPATVSANR